MSIVRLTVPAIVVIGFGLTAGCGNPEQSAANGAADADAQWHEAFGESDPLRRLKAFDAAIARLDEVASDYPDTATGQALAAGRSVGNVSLASMRAVRDSLAPRAECYARPTAQCLQAFASQSSRGNAAGSGDPQAEAERLICERGFAAADRELESFKINRPVYAQQLVQLAFAAEACGKPAEVVAAIGAYKAAEPSSGPDKIGALLSIAVTPQFRAAWPSVLADLEGLVEQPGLDPGSIASVILTMATSYAALGNSDKALEHYRYFTDTLNYQADFATLRELGADLVLAGAADAGIAVMGGSKPYITSMLYGAAEELASRVGLQDKGSSTLRLVGVKAVGDYLAPPADRGRFAPAAASLEAALDGFVPTIDVRDGIGQIDRAYALLALVQQKLGDPDRAMAALGKARHLLDDFASQGGRGTIADYEAPILLAHGQIDEAVALVPELSVRGFYIPLIVQAVTATGDVERALTTVGRLGNIGSQGYPVVIQTLIGMGEIDKAEQVINAYSGNVNEKQAMQWQLVAEAADQGSPSRAEALANQYALINGPSDRLRLLTLFLNSDKVAGNRRDAEPIIREIFEIGEQIDRAGASAGVFDRRDTFYAQEAAAQAFRNGHTALGIELYRAAGNKNQTPLFAAFNDKLDPDDLPAILMLAQDSLSGEPLGYVIDAAIRHLEGARA